MRRHSLQLSVAIFAITMAGAASAQNELGLQGVVSLAFAYSSQETELEYGGKLSDGVGIDFDAGFQAGENFAFLLGYEWQTSADFDSFYFPVSVRAYSPLLLERVRLYGTVGIGVFFARLHHEFNANGTERAGAFDAGGGFHVDITEDVALLAYARYKRGFGEVDDFESVVSGVGFEYRWGL